MAFRVTCPACKALCDVAEEHVGKRILCPACQKPFQLALATPRPASAPARPVVSPKAIQPAASSKATPPAGKPRTLPIEKKGAVLQTARIGYYRNRRKRRGGRGWFLAGSAAALLLIGASVAFLILRPKPERAAAATMVARNATAAKPVIAPAAAPTNAADSKKTQPTVAARQPATAPTSRSPEQEVSKKPASAPEKGAPVIQAEKSSSDKETPKKPAAPEAKTPDVQANAASPEQKVPPLKHLLVLRRAGWQTVLTLLPTLEAADAKENPGILAFAKDLRAWEKKIDVKLSPEQWPPMDIDALVSRNGNFWQASFEIAPGDPALFSLHAGLLLSAGEGMRAWQVLTLARQRPGIPKNVFEGIEKLRTQVSVLIAQGNAKVKTGIQRFDAGDRKEALRLYREAVAEWTQNSMAHYEIGLTLYFEEEVAAGRPLPKMGTVKINSGFEYSAEVARRFTLARQHNPLDPMTYKGSDKAVTSRALPLVTKVLPTWKKIMEANKLVDDAILAELSEACQEAALDDLALASRQLLAARRNRYMPADLAFLKTSLERLAPGPQTEATLKALAREKITVRQLIKPEQGAPAQEAFTAAKLKQVRLYVPPNRVGKDLQPLGRYIKALEKATADYLQVQPKPEAKGLLIAVGIKAGMKSRAWCQAVEGRAAADLLRGLEKALEKVEPIAVIQAPVAFGMEMELWAQQPSAFPEFPDAWQEGAKKTNKKQVVPPDELFQILWPDA
jgi:hypothetical protein